MTARNAAVNTRRATGFAAALAILMAIPGTLHAQYWDLYCKESGKSTVNATCYPAREDPWVYWGGSFNYGVYSYNKPSMEAVTSDMEAQIDSRFPGLFCGGVDVHPQEPWFVQEVAGARHEGINLWIGGDLRQGNNCVPAGGCCSSNSAHRSKQFHCERPAQGPFLGPGNSHFCVRYRSNTCSPSTPNPVSIADGVKQFRRLGDAPILEHFRFFRSYESLPSYAGHGLLNGPRPDDTVGWQASYDANVTQTTDMAGTTTVFNVVIPGDVPRSYVQQGSGELLAKQRDAGRLMRSVAGGFLFFHPDATLWEFDASGRLVGIRERSGDRVTLDYSGDTLVGVTDTAGRTLAVTLDARGLIDTLQAPDDSVFQYEFDDSARLTGIRFPSEGPAPLQRRLLYENAKFPGAVTGEIDETGTRVATYSYDADGRAIRTTKFGTGGVEIETYQLDFSQASYPKVTDPLGATRTYMVSSRGEWMSVSQPGGSGCNPATARQAYDAQGNLASANDFNGFRRCFGYDTTRNLETVLVEGLPGSAACGYLLPNGATLPAGSRKTTRQWHPDWGLETRRAEPKRITTWVYNGQPDPTEGGAIASCAPSDAYVADTLPIAVLCKRVEQATTDETGAQGFAAPQTGTPRTWRYTYNRHGRVLTEDGPRGDVADVTTTAYWPLDGICPGAGEGPGMDKGCRGLPMSVTNALGQVTRYLKYTAHGQLLEMRDANDLATWLSYDTRQRLTGQRTGSDLVEYQYDVAGHLIRVVSAGLGELNYSRDPAGRLMSVSDAQGNRITYTLDAMGNRLREDVTDPEGTLVRTQSRVYDALSRLQNLFQPQ